MTSLQACVLYIYTAVYKIVYVVGQLVFGSELGHRANKVKRMELVSLAVRTDLYISTHTHAHTQARASRDTNTETIVPTVTFYQMSLNMPVYPCVRSHGYGSE
jgi:hypothetical protein